MAIRHRGGDLIPDNPSPHFRRPAKTSFMPLRKIISLPLLLLLYLLALAGLGGYLFWPESEKTPLQVTRASLSPEGDRILLEGEGFSEATEVSLSLDVNNSRFFRHTVPTYGRGVDMVRVGGFAYVLVQKKGLVILDLAEPQRPRVISTLEIPGVVTNLTVSEGTAYIACGRHGLALVDVRDPQAPRLLATLPELQMVQGLAVGGGRLFASVYARGVEPALAVVDISEPSRPRLLGRVPLPGQPLGVALSGKNLLVAAGKAGLISLKIGEGLPRLSTLLPLPDTAQSLVVAGDHAYVACTLGGLAVVEMTTGFPKLQAHLPLPGRPVRLVVEGERLYLCSFSEGGHVVDIGNPSKPQAIGTFNLSGGLSSVAALDSILYLNSFKVGVQVVDVSQPTLKQNPDQSSLGEVVGGIEQEGDLVAVTTKSGRLSLYQRQPGMAPGYLSTLQLKGAKEALQLALDSGFAYVKGSNYGMTVVDVRDPQAPVPVGHYPFKRGEKTLANDLGRYSSLAVSEGRGALIDDNGQLWLFDKNQPGDLQLWSSPAIQEQVTKMVWDEEFLYVVTASSQSIRAIDFRNPLSPVVLPVLSLPTKAIVDMAIVDRTVVLACGLEGLITVDFDNPAAPRLLTILPLPIFASRIRQEGSTAYVGDRRGGLLKVDLGDPATPRFGGLLTDAGVVEDFIISGNQALIAAGPGGLVVVPLPQDLQPVDRKEREMRLALPAIDTSGHYTLRVTDGAQSVVLPGVLALAPR